MSNRLVLVENRSFVSLQASQQAHLEQSLRRVCGSRLIHTLSLSSEMASPDFSDCVFVCPIVLPLFIEDILASKRVMERHFPSRFLYGVFFPLFLESTFSPESFLDAFWVETLDSFYDQAVPIGFSVLNAELPVVQGFEVVSGVSSLFRDIDNLAELRRIAASLEDLEERVGQLEDVADAR